jgi:glucose/arabinose dehydrogenase
MRASSPFASPRSRRTSRAWLAPALLGLVTAGALHAQQPAAPAPADAKPPAPSWQQGRSAAQERSPLHPFAPILTGRPASELPLDRLKVPPGFKVEVWAEGVPEARSLALGDKGTVFVSNRNLTNVYAVIDQGGRREVKKILTGLKSPNGIAFSRAPCTSPNATASPATTASRTGWTARPRPRW